MTSAHAPRQRGRQTVQLQSPLSPADCVRRLEAWDQRPQSAFAFLAGRMQGIALLVFTCFGLAFFCADLCFTRWVRRDEPRQMTAFLSTTLQAAPDSTVGQASDTQRTEQDR